MICSSFSSRTTRSSRYVERNTQLHLIQNIRRSECRPIQRRCDFGEGADALELIEIRVASSVFYGP